MRNSAWLVCLCCLLLSPCTATPLWAGDAGLVQALRDLARPLNGPDDLDPLVERASSARLVLLGEASHGTHEFQLWRDALSRRLIAEQGFSFVAIEGDWASLVALDRYVRHAPDAPPSARAALAHITRWPRWVWANEELAAFGEWLRGFNARRPADARVGIHGIDLYAIWASADAVQAYFDRQAPAAAARVRDAYRALQDFRDDPGSYADAGADTGYPVSTAVQRVAQELAARYRDARRGRRETLFEVLQHARAVAGGERYLRLLKGPARDAWNARSEHFVRTVDALLGHYGRASRAIVWAHNTHVGDARATDMRRTGETNLGQRVRERHGRHRVLIVGAGTAQGSVLAARHWDAPRETMQTPLPRGDSFEAALLAAGGGDRLLLFDGRARHMAPLQRMLPHRAIGVVFVPRRESRNNYVPSLPVLRYDAFVFMPRTRALRVLPVP